MIWNASYDVRYTIQDRKYRKLRLGNIGHSSATELKDRWKICLTKKDQKH